MSTNAGPGTNVHFVHFPKLVVPSEGNEVLGGHLGRFAFADFQQLDCDWANQILFDRTQPTVWEYADESQVNGETRYEALARVDRQARLIYYALLVEGDQLLPDPQMSVHYARIGETTIQQKLGPYDRTFLLNGARFAQVEPAILRQVGARARRWETHGLKADARIFGPLQGLALLASGTTDLALGVVPLVVSLEGYLLGRKVTGGIAAALTRQIDALLSSSSDLEARVRRLYAWRSDILHGRKPQDVAFLELCDWLSNVTRAIVRQGAERAISRATDGNDLSVVRIEE